SVPGLICSRHTGDHDSDCPAAVADPGRAPRGPMQPMVMAELDLDPADRSEAVRLLAELAGSEQVAAALDILRQRLGQFPAAPATGEFGERAWTCAILLFAPAVAAWHAARSIDPDITAATLADVGRQFRLHRTTHGAFGLETWNWLTMHLAGGLLQLGRLQFALRELEQNEPVPRAAREWVLDVHIPPTGPLTVDAVQASFQRAEHFFPVHFPERHAEVAICLSWLLDPWLGAALADTNIGRFQRLFTGYGHSVPAQDDVLYFVFRVRGAVDLQQLPRKTTLQRVVLERIEDGGMWLACRGFHLLDDATALPTNGWC
ncbi:MAG: acyltransferase domain-containing protein, partial [Actinomycetota bacterium]|nr:acyltransferase domain-containing protein [Actinomycetota bacterium]